jgi:two-component system, chemotaxis family, chemotaxis protein CheY
LLTKEVPVPYKVLMVDDSLLARKLVMRALPPGWASEIRHATNGEEALAALDAAPPDVLFLDLNMPTMDGYEVLAALRSKGIETATFVLSADIQPMAVERALALGAKGFVKKPVDAGALADALRRAGVL